LSLDRYRNMMASGSNFFQSGRYGETGRSRLAVNISGGSMQYQVEADWHLLNTCNYRCDYCFFSDEFLSAKLSAVASSEEWTRSFDKSGLTWLLHLTGGEPSLYPDFAGLCASLTKRHFISVNSNMTNSDWKRFARQVDPSRVSFVNAGLHFEERQRKSGNTAYLEHVALLRNAGFQVYCSLVGAPRALARFEAAVELLGSIGMFPIPKLMRGTFGGRRYPDAYTHEERVMFGEFAERARAFYAPALAQRSERPTLDMFGDDRFLDGEPSYHGLSCEAGRLFVRIDPLGELFRCGTSTSLGNIRAGSFARSNSASPCDTSYCFYFCQKYSVASVERRERANLFEMRE